MSEIKNGGLDQYGAGPFEQQQFGTAGVEVVNVSAFPSRPTILVHVDLKTLVQTTGTALVAACLVNKAPATRQALRPARVLTPFVDAALEEARTTCRTANIHFPVSHQILKL